MSDSRRSRRVTTAPWYASGLCFTCRPDCGACCVNHGEQTHVYVDEAESLRIAEHLQLPLETFRQRYTRANGEDRLLLDAGDACVFLVGRRCTVYEARPRQCRTFPFWPETLSSKRSWNALAEFCPGVNDGDLHPREAIDARLGEYEDG